MQNCVCAQVGSRLKYRLVIGVQDLNGLLVEAPSVLAMWLQRRMPVLSSLNMPCLG